MLVRSLIAGILLTLSTSVMAEVELEVGDGVGGVLDGFEITYAYEKTRAFVLRFENGTITYSYQMEDGSYSEFRSTVPYFGRKMDDGEYYIGWHEEDVTNYVTLLINFEEMTIYSSALLGNYDVIHFQKADISQIKR